MSKIVKCFKDFVTLQRGFDLPNSSRIDGHVPIVASTGISGYHNQSKVKAPGVVTGRSGSLGTVQYIVLDFWPLNTSLWVKDFKGNYPKYVYYYLQTMHLEQYNSGAGVPTLNRNDLDAVNIEIHSQNDQRKIVHVLSAYDDLIENTNRRIAIQEEMAQRLYREWFVHFRFPGHETIKMVESELGMIPETWHLSSVGTVTDKIFSGGTPTTTKSEYWDGAIPWLSSGETRNHYVVSTEKTITSEGVENSSTRKANRYDIVIASAGQGKTRGQISLLLLDTYINQSVIAIRAKKYWMPYLFFNIQDRYDELRNISDASSIRGSLTTQIIKELPILLPDRETLEQYYKTVLPIIELIGNLTAKNEILNRTRDLLLPRLISGDIDVSNLEIPIREE